VFPVASVLLTRVRPFVSVRPTALLGRVVLTVGTRLSLTVFGLGTSIVSARYLGESGRGDYFFMITLAATLVQVANLGLPVSNTYLAAQDSKLLGRLLVNGFWIALGVGGGVGVGLAVVAHAAGMLQDTPLSFLWLAAALTPPSLFFLLAANLLVGVERISAYNGAEIASRVLVLAAMLVAGVAGASASGFVVASIAAWSVAALLTGLLVVGRSRPHPSFDVTVFARGFRYATKAYLVTLLGFLVLRSNVFLLRHYYGPAELGLYSIAAQISDVLSVLPQAVALVLFPRLVREAGARWEAVKRSALLVGGVMLLVGAAAAAVADPVIRLLYGDTFAPSAAILRLMLPGVIFLAVANILSQYLSAVGLPRPVVVLWGGALAILVALSATLIPAHAGSGAAAALSTTYAGVLLGVIVLVRRHHAREQDENLGPPVPADPEDLTPVGE
jgi:O-antigen/teichoic acid export membrane protein